MKDRRINTPAVGVHFFFHFHKFLNLVILLQVSYTKILNTSELVRQAKKLIEMS